LVVEFITTAPPVRAAVTVASLVTHDPTYGLLLRAVTGIDMRYVPVPKVDDEPNVTLAWNSTRLPTWMYFAATMAFPSAGATPDDVHDRDAE
jgi:DNA-binding transcriptional MocR family regulator